MDGKCLATSKYPNKNYTYPDYLLKLFIFDVHVLYRIQRGNTIREPMDHFLDGFADAKSVISWSEVLRQV